MGRSVFGDGLIEVHQSPDEECPNSGLVGFERRFSCDGFRVDFSGADAIALEVHKALHLRKFIGGR